MAQGDAIAVFIQHGDTLICYASGAVKRQKRTVVMVRRNITCTHVAAEPQFCRLITTLRGRGFSGRRELLGRPVTEVHRLLLRCLTDATAVGDDRGGGRDIGEAQRGLRRPVQTIQLGHQQPDAGHADVWRLLGAEQGDFVHKEISWCLLLRQNLLADRPKRSLRLPSVCCR